MLTRGSSFRGFTLIELMVTIAVFAILAFASMPMYVEYMSNSRVRAAASSLIDGMQTARVEALKRNREVEFVLTEDPASDADVSPSLNGKNWVVRLSTDGGNTYTFISGSNTGHLGSAPSTTAFTYGSTVDQIRFSGLGNATPQTAFIISNPDLGTCAKDGGKLRCLQIVVSSNGEVRMCDPAVDAPDTRHC